MRARTSLTLIALLLVSPQAQAGSIDKAKLRQLIELPETSVFVGIGYSTTLGFYFTEHKPDPRVEIARLQKELKGDASNAERYLRLQQLYSKAGRHKESDDANATAVALCRKQVREHPDDMHWLALLGDALVSGGEVQEGEALLRRAVKEAPKEWRAWLALGECVDNLSIRAVMGENKFSFHFLHSKLLSSSLLEKKPMPEQVAKMRKLRAEARRYYDRAIELVPRETAPYSRRLGSRWIHAAFDAALDGHKDKKVSILAIFATPECVADMACIARLSPDDPSIVGSSLLIAFLAGLQQKKETASDAPSSIEEFLAEQKRTLLDRLPGESGTSARWSMQRLEQLTEHADKTVAATASELLADMLMVMKKFDEDRDSSRGSMGLMGGAGLGEDAPATLDKNTAAIVKHLRRVVQLDPSRDTAWDLLTALLVKAKHTREALEIGQKRLKIKDNAHNRFSLAKIYAEDKQWAEAARHLRTAVQNDPQHLDSRLALITVLLKSDKTAALKEAGEQLDAAEPLAQGAKRKSFARYLALRRGIHAALNDHPRQAKEAFKRVLREDKGNKNAGWGIAALGEPLTPADQELAIAYLRARKGTIEHADERPGVVVKANLYDDGITDEDLFYLTVFSELRELTLGGRNITNVGLAYVAGLTTLESLSLNYTKITDKGLSCLKSLSNLRSLELTGFDFTAASLAPLEAFPKLERLALENYGIFIHEEAAQAGLAHLRKLPNLREVSISGAVTDKGLVHLAALPRLEKLELHGDKITDEGMKHLARCTGLRTLDIRSEQVTDAGLVHLKELRHLRELRLYTAKITGAGLVHLKGLTHLKILDLTDSAITDEGLANLSGLTNLRELNLADYRSEMDAIFGKAFENVFDKFAPSDKKSPPAKKPAKPRITDAGLKHLRVLTKLTDLDLHGRPITDAGLTQLSELKNLHQLIVRSTKVTPEGIAQLRKTLPKLAVSR